MRRNWAIRLRWLLPLIFGCKAVSGSPDDALLLNRHPIEGRISHSVAPLLAYHEPTPPTVPWNTRPRTDLAEGTPRPTRVERNVPGVLTRFPKAAEEPKKP